MCFHPLIIHFHNVRYLFYLSARYKVQTSLLNMNKCLNITKHLPKLNTLT